MALQGPNLYTVSSLVDIEEAVESEWHILEPPESGKAVYGTGFTGRIQCRFHPKLQVSPPYSLNFCCRPSNPSSYE